MNNQFDPNNMSGWQQQQQNLQRMQQQFKMQNTTSAGKRILISLIFGFVPQLLLSIFGTESASKKIEQPLEYGILWLIGLALIVVGGICAALLVKFSKNVKSDVIIPTTGMSAAMLSFTVFLVVPNVIGPNANGVYTENGIAMIFVAMFMAFVFYFVAAIITWVIIFMFMMNKMKKQFMNGTNPFQNMMHPNTNQNQQETTKNVWYKKTSNKPEEKETNVEELDSGFGTHFEPEEAQDVKGKTKSSTDDSKTSDDSDKEEK